MKRRDFIRLVAFGTGSFLVPASLIAQSSKSHALIGWLGGSSQLASSGIISAFLGGLKELGYVDGRDFEMVCKFAEGHLDRLDSLAEDGHSSRGHTCGNFRPSSNSSSISRRRKHLV